MAVYTHVSAEVLAAFLKRFDVGWIGERTGRSTGRAMKIRLARL